jgi:hypothetical protein
MPYAEVFDTSAIWHIFPSEARPIRGVGGRASGSAAVLTAGRVKGFADWKPQKKTEEIVLDIEDVLEECQSYLPLTVRQVFYRQASIK